MLLVKTVSDLQENPCKIFPLSILYAAGFNIKTFKFRKLLIYSKFAQFFITNCAELY